jgi:hypothetical protein
VLGVLVKQRKMSLASVILQRGEVAGAGVRLDPVVDRLPCHAEHARDSSGRAAMVEFQDGQGSPEKANVLGSRKLSSEAVTLPGSQVELAHVLLLHC